MMRSAIRLVPAAAWLAATLAVAPVAAAQAVVDDLLVTLSFVDSDVRDALRLVGKQCGVNMVMSQEVKGTITLDLEGTTLDETLDAIVRVSGFHYERDGKIVTVHSLEELLGDRQQREAFAGPAPAPVPLEAETLVLQLRFVDAERVEPIVRTLLSETGKVSILKTSDHIAQERGNVQNLRPNANVAQNAAGGVPALDLQIGSRLSTSTQGEPAKSHTLVVTDVPDRLRRIDRAISSIDIRPAQVVIEARFVEIALDDNQRLGIDWSVVGRMTGGSTATTLPFGSTTLGTFNPKVDGGSPGGLFPAAPASVATAGQAGLFTFGSLDFTAFTAVLEMIQRETDVQMVSNPSIIVRDRHTATILVGERYPILSANVSEFGTVTEQLDHYEPVGVQLAVTPSILDGEVELVVRPSSSSLGADVEGSTGLRVARINSRQIDTDVTVKDGQTVVLGGLITTRDVEVETSVPFVGKIPLLGKLFQSRTRAQERVDLVVFLTVTIVQEHGLTDEQRRLFEKTSLGTKSFESKAPIRTPLNFVASPPSF